MKTLFLECNMGAAGDMLMASLSELLPEPDKFMEELKELGFPGIEISREYAASAGIRGARIHVLIHGEEETSNDVPQAGTACDDHKQVDHHHHHDGAKINEDGAGNAFHNHNRHHRHTSMAEIRRIIMGLPVSDRVKDDVLAVYSLIAEAESQAHGCPVEEIHFHEVGAMDALTDITGVSLLMEKIGAEKICCSPINVGSGTVRCAHGILPVPTPATAAILQGVPCYGSTFRGELCTPTGAALLKHFVSAFGPMPVMTTEKIGVGVGAKEFPAANILRAFLGETNMPMVTVEELSCNLDDCTGEEIGFAFELLLDSGALDVFLTPIQMKKSRPGTLLTVISKPEDAEKLAALLLRHTTTLGVRRKTCSRTCMHRFVETRDTPFGPVRVKTAKNSNFAKSKIEYEDAARIALTQGIPLRDVLKEL
ncbi:MAG TPA: nickel pincer cofactor biosynthesis protein LarC [Clostridiales bacterium]|nr:nickel pincer cofactor biosynthesis protein LarC [Clostridiales bacterium]